MTNPPGGVLRASFYRGKTCSLQRSVHPERMRRSLPRTPAVLLSATALAAVRLLNIIALLLRLGSTRIFRASLGCALLLLAPTAALGACQCRFTRVELVCIAGAMCSASALCRNFTLSLRVHGRETAPGTSGSCHVCSPKVPTRIGWRYKVLVWAPTIDSGPWHTYARLNQRPTVDLIVDIP